MCDRRIGRWTPLYFNTPVVLLAILAAFIHSEPIFVLVVAAAALANGLLLFRYLSRVGHWIAFVTSTDVLFRLTAEPVILKFTQNEQSRPCAVTFPFRELIYISVCECTIQWTQTRKSHDTWVVVKLCPEATLSLHTALGSWDKKMMLQYWILSFLAKDELLFRWNSTFIPSAHDFVRSLSQSSGLSVRETEHASLALNNFVALADGEQRAAIRQLVRLGFRQSALLIVMRAKRLSIEESSREIESWTR